MATEYTSSAVLAECFGISTRQVRSLHEDGHFPKDGDNRFDWQAAVKWYVNNIKQKQMGKDAGIAKRKEIAETEIKEEQVLEKRLKRMERTKELVEGALIVDAIESYTNSVRRISETTPLELKRVFPDIPNEYLKELDKILVRMCNIKAIWPPKELM